VRDRRHPRAPTAIGVEDDLGVRLGVKAVEQPAEYALALDVVDEH
jgi:hypothetical protein